ncbi:hypothetical protein [Rothia halotolerans]|uniref:hypothetical protein n=1 Tax=Rothia halotolerans TaxID=405770 RepID=UPI00101B7A27|nr:hypothetical protein [Rothia halotolerans]
MRTLKRLSLPAVLVALLAAGCGSSSEAEGEGGDSAAGSPAASSSSAAETSSPDASSTEASPEETPSPEASSGSSASEGTAAPSSEASPPASGAQGNVLTVRTGSEEHEFTPDIVRCSGEPGNIQHLVASVNNQPPLFRLAGGELAMYKPEKQGPPYKTNSPADVGYTDEGLVAEGADIGGAVITGELSCTEWESD